MRILFVISNYFPVLGGAELYAQGIAERLAAKGHDVHVITEAQPEALAFERINGVSVHRLDGIKFWFKKMTYWPLLEGKVREIKPDFIQCTGHGHLHTLNCALVAKKLKMPLAVLTYGPLVHQTKRGQIEKLLTRGYDFALTPYIFKNCAVVLYRTPAMGGWCRGKGAGHAVLATTGIDAAFFREAGEKTNNEFKCRFGGRKVAGFVGTLCRRKGAAELVECVPAVVQKHPDALFVFVGSANPETEKGFLLGLKKRVNELGIGSHVLFLPPIRQDSTQGKMKLVRLFDSFDVFCLPSAFEAPSQAMLQAMARGKPVVVAGIPALDGLVSGRNGAIVGYGKPKELASAISRLLGGGESAKRTGCYNRREARRYSLDRLAAEAEALYGGIIRTPRGTGT